MTASGYSFDADRKLILEPEQSQHNRVLRDLYRALECLDPDNRLLGRGYVDKHGEFHMNSVWFMKLINTEKIEDIKYYNSDKKLQTPKIEPPSEETQYRDELSREVERLARNLREP